MRPKPQQHTEATRKIFIPRPASAAEPKLLSPVQRLHLLQPINQEPPAAAAAAGALARHRIYAPRSIEEALVWPASGTKIDAPPRRRPPRCDESGLAYI